MKEIRLSDAIHVSLVTSSEKRWVAFQEAKHKSFEDFLPSYPSLKDNPLYRKKWGTGIHPQRGARGGGLFPVLCLLRDGRLACVMRTGMYHVGPGQISISFSEDKGKTWSPYAVVADSDGYQDKRDPAFGQAANGDLIIVYGILDKYRESFAPNDVMNYYPMEVIRSSDGGLTWSRPAPLQYDLGGLYLKPHGQMRRLNNGTLVFNARGCYRQELFKQYPRLASRATYLFRSQDGGRTWPKQTNVLVGFTETEFLELDEQHWLAYCRGSADNRIAHSYDGGHTWQDTEVLFPDDDPEKQKRRLPGQPTLLPNGKLIVTYGYRTVPFGVRVVVSHDGGKTFDRDTEYIITDSYFLPDCGYPSTVVFPDGTIVTAAYTISDNLHEDWNTCCMAYVYSQNVYAKKTLTNS